MLYRITIEQIENVTITKQRHEKVADSGNPRDKGPVYEYVPYTDTEERRTTVLLQTVADIDLPAVICAVNQIKPA